MQVKSISNFISNLDRINRSDKCNKYITFNGHSYELISDKRQKSLKTADIAVAAKEIFEQLKVQQNISDTLKGYSFISLSESLCDYLKRVNSSKKWYHRVASFFGFVSKHEKNINQIMLEAHKNGYKLIHKPSEIPHYIETIIELEKIHIKNLDEDARLNLFEKSILDSSLISNITNRGGFGGTVFSWYEEYLHTFLKEKEGLYSPPEKEQWNQFIKDLEVSHKLHAAMIALLATRCIRDKWIKLEPEHLSNLNKMTTEICLDKISKLKPGGRLIIPGGYEVQKDKGSQGHAIVYVIQKEDNGNFSFDVINTGHGVEFLKKSHKPNGMIRQVTKDVKYENIPGKLLSNDFFLKLNEFNLDGKEASMSGPLSLLEKTFGKNRRSANGREHNVQRKGSCVYKSLSSTAKKHLPKKMFLDFKVWLTEQELQKMKALNPTKVKRQKITQKDVNTWIDEGNKVLERRKQKAFKAAS